MPLRKLCIGCCGVVAGMRELLRAVMTLKPIITIVEPEKKHGALTYQDVCKELQNAVGMLAEWGLAADIQLWQQEEGLGSAPTAEQLVDALFTKDDVLVLEWNRVRDLADITFQLLVERILPAQARQATYVEGSIMMHKLTPATLAHGGECHVYCSMHNQGAEQLVNDALHACGQAGHGIKVCTDPVQIAMCAKFVLYLDGRTWNGDELSAKKLAEEVEQAVEAGLKLCLAHEVPMFAFPGSGWDHIKAMEGSKKPTV